MQNISPKKELKMRKRISLKMLSRRRQNGIRVMRGEIGTKGMESRHMQKGKKENMFVHIVGSVSRQPKSMLKGQTCFARTTARAHTGAKQGLMTLKKSVNAVAQNTLLTSTPSPNIVRVVSVKKDRKADVYNMVVDDNHNFLICGGIVSHNCDAMRYFVKTYGIAAPKKPYVSPYGRF